MSMTLPGTGEIVSDEIIGGEHIQRIKLTWGDAGVADDVSANKPLPVTGNVTVVSAPTTNVVLTGQTGAVAVAGTFFQATQPISGNVNASIVGTVPVTGNFFQATQPISGNVNAAVTGNVNILGNVPVTGTFFQATQPVSGNVNAAVTGNVGVTGNVAVTGTFWQATQPISGNVGITGTVPVSGNVGITGNVPLPTGASTEATLASILTKTPALGANTAANSSPIAWPTDQPSFADQMVTGQAGQTALGNNPLLAVAGTGGLDCSGYKSISIQWIPSGGTLSAGTVVYEASNDGVSWTPQVMVDSSASSTNTASSSGFVNGTSKFLYTALLFRYFRARISVGVTGGGSLQAITRLTTATYSPPTLYVQSNAAATFPVQLDGTNPAAAADGFSNPSVRNFGSFASTFNGLQWDRFRGNAFTTTTDTGAKTTTFNGASVTNPNGKGAYILINVGTVSGTTPSMACKLQGSIDNGATFFDITGATWPAITATGQYVLLIYPAVPAVANAVVSAPLPRIWRVVYTITGTTPSFTLTNVQVGYQN